MLAVFILSMCGMKPSMKIKVIGTEAEQAWIKRLIYPYITHFSKPYDRAKSGVCRVHYDVEPPETEATAVCGRIPD